MEAEINMSKLNYSEFEKYISSNKIPKIYFFQGEEYLVDTAENLLKHKILGNKYSDFDLNSFNEESITLEKLMSSSETFPVTTDSKLIILRNLPLETWEDKEIDNFLEILNELPEFTYLIFSQITKIENLKNINKLKKIEKLFQKKGIICNFSKEDICLEKKLINWAKENYGKNLSMYYAKKIKELCSNQNINSIKNELQKICELEDSNTITEDSMKALIKYNDKINIFELPKAIQSKNLSKSLTLLSKLLLQGEEPIVLISIIISNYIDLFRAKTFDIKEIPIKKIFEIYNYKNKEFKIKNSIKACRNISSTQIKNSLKCLIQADLELKSTNLNPETILSKTIIKLIKL